MHFNDANWLILMGQREKKRTQKATNDSYTQSVRVLLCVRIIIIIDPE